MPTLFVTGATGFIGSHFVNTATKKGYRVRALRRSEKESAVATESPVEWITGSLASIESSVLHGVDTFVHLAAVGVSPKTATWQEYFRGNVSDSVGAWIKGVEADIPRFVICGSCFEYGTAGERFDFIPPHAPLEPSGGYAASKAAASLAAIGLAQGHGLQLAVLRPFNTFGDGMNPNSFWAQLEQAARSGADFPMTSGQQVRDFMAVDQLVAQILEYCQAPLEAGAPLIANLGSGQPRTILEYAQDWWAKLEASGKILAGKVPYRRGEVMRYAPEINTTHIVSR